DHDFEDSPPAARTAGPALPADNDVCGQQRPTVPAFAQAVTTRRSLSHRRGTATGPGCLRIRGPLVFRRGSAVSPESSGADGTCQRRHYGNVARHGRETLAHFDLTCKQNDGTFQTWS